MQLCPYLATVTRPVYWDRAGFLYLEVDCPDCGGDGEVPYSTINPSEKDGVQTCGCCNGTGRIYEQTCEDELAVAA